MSTSEEKNIKQGFSQNRLLIFRKALSGSGETLLKHIGDHPELADVDKVIESAKNSITAEGAVTTEGTVTAEEAARLRLANLVADVANNDVKLASHILEDKNVENARSIAIHYGQKRIASLLADNGAAIQFRRRMFAIEPTSVLQQMIATDNEEENPSDAIPVHSSPAVRTQIARFLNRRPLFDIRTTSVLVPLKEHLPGDEEMNSKTRQEVAQSLELLQRVQALAPSPEVIKPLLEAGMTSALRLSSVPKKTFMKKFVPQLSQSAGSQLDAELMAGRIYDHAMASRARANHALMQIHQAVKGTGLAPIDGLTALADRKLMFERAADAALGTKSLINLDQLFGDMDMCECDECLDVTSPTAYFVDLLQYLRNNNLDDASEWHNTGKEGYSNTALEKLLIRRPDLQHLKLTCENANTILPMIDLVNEIMESFVINLDDYAQHWTPMKQLELETWNIDGEQTNNLLATPSYTRKKAYCILKEAVYPVTSLPYFQPLDAIRLYLHFLGTSRFELIDTFRLAQRQWKVRSSFLGTPEKIAKFSGLRGRVQDRAVAAEYLGLSPDEYIIITRQALWPIECSEFVDNGALISLEDYRREICVRPAESYWGYSNPQALLSSDPANPGLGFVKAQFLPRSGLSYAETADLVRTFYVNPMLPTGREKVLFDSIRFSYRFLQRLALGTTDNVQRNNLISNFLYRVQPWVQIALLQQTPPTGNKLVPKDSSVQSFTETEIRNFVAKWFSCIGKLVVLEAGLGPVLPVGGYLIWIPPNRESGGDTTGSDVTDDASRPSRTDIKILGYLDMTGALFDDSNTLQGLVWMNGLVFYQGYRPIRETFLGGRLVLTQVPRQTENISLELLLQGTPKETVLINADSFLEVDRHGMDLPSVRVNWIIPPDTCSIEKTKLIHLNGSELGLWEWDRINRFIRLYRKLVTERWTITQVDAAISGLWKVPEVHHIPIGSVSSGSTTGLHTPSEEDEAFSFSGYRDPGCGCDDGDGGGNGNGSSGQRSPCDPSNYPDIAPGFLKELMSIKKLQKRTGIELENLLCLWTNMPTHGEKSIYARLFLTAELKMIDPIFQPDSNGSHLSSMPKIGEHVPVLLAALPLKAEEFNDVLRAAGLVRTDPITIPNLTMLYRYPLLAKVLAVKVVALLQIIELFAQPFRSASATLELSLLWSRISKAGFTIKQLRFVFLGEDPRGEIAPSKVKVLKTTKTLIDGLAAIDMIHPDLLPQQEAVLTANDAKTISTLLFAPPVVEDIMGLIEGTKLYTTNAPDRLSMDSTKLPAKLIYSNSQTASNRRSTLSVVGNLTEAELSEAESLFPGNESWNSALLRLKRQSINLVRATLSTVFGDKIDDAVNVLTQGDVPPRQASETDSGDPGTALGKRIYFMKAFLPSLRSYLASKLVITTMSSVASVSTEICALLLNEIIKIDQGGTQVPAMQLLKNVVPIPSSTSTDSWSGNLIPPSTNTYTFYAYGNSDSRPPPLNLDGQSRPFTVQNEDPSDLWWTDPVPLIGGKTYELNIEHSNPSGLQWKTERTAVAVIPTSALVPNVSVAGVEAIFAQMTKASIVIQGFSLDVAEVVHFQSQGHAFDGLDFNAIKTHAWKRLLAYTELKKSIPAQETTWIDLFKWAGQRDERSIDEICEKISAVTTFDKVTIKTLIDKKNLDLIDVRHYRNELAVVKIAEVFSFIQKTGIRDAELILSWTDLKLDFTPTWNTAKSIHHTIRGRYSLEDYDQAIKPVHDQLRKNQRDSLVAYLLVQEHVRKWGVTDADGLFEFFLIDVQMGSCMETSRTKQAISSVQLFVQRCMLGLEEDFGVKNDALDAERWKWMSKQTIWTANRKVFLYPENWLVPSLRDDKTPIYQGMEAEMLQKDLNPTRVLDSFKSFVTQLDQIAQLRVVGLYVEAIKDGSYRLHCVGMTVGAPYMFFHRTFTSSDHEWAPWSQIPLDIPTYTRIWRIPHGPVEFPTYYTEDSLTGCYVTPVVWKSRILLFIGQLNKKTIPNETAVGTRFSEFTNPNSQTTAKSIAPLEAWEIKLGWSEYRSNRWTQKQISAESITTRINASITLPDVDSFQFIPQIVTGVEDFVRIDVWYQGQIFAGEYIFGGSIVRKGQASTRDAPQNWQPTNFHLSNGLSTPFWASSLQNSEDGQTMPYFNKAPYIMYSSNQNAQGVITYMDYSSDLFYHPFSNSLLSAASVSDPTNPTAGPILAVYRGLPEELSVPAFGTGQTEIGSDNQEYPTYSELSRTYSNYNWDLGFHGPMQIAEAYLGSNQLDQALNMIHLVFDPYADGEDIRRVWQWPPFQMANAERVLETILNRLKPRNFDQKITKWRDRPFEPHVVARGRIVAYMKWTVMMYIRVLIAYGDYYFRRRTLEDVPLAIQCYVLASHMYGPKGETIPKRGRKIAQTYFSLLSKWDAFSNAVVQLELAFPFSNQTPFPFEVVSDEWHPSSKVEDQFALANLFGFSTSGYFCLPDNPDLRRLRSTIDLRLYNIRHCLDIDGRPMPLALWDPPIDPAELVRAVGAGLSLSSALEDLNASLPNYRFPWLLSRAIEMTNELKSLESAFLSIKEKRDGEALQRLRTSHEIALHQTTLEMKKVQLDEADKTLKALRVSQESPRYRYAFFSSLAGADAQPLPSGTDPYRPFELKIDAPTTNGDLHLSKYEKQEMDKAEQAQTWNNVTAGHEIVAGILHSVPSFNIHTTPMGCGVEVQWGMPNIAASVQAQGRLMQVFASEASYKSGEAARKSANVKQYQDRINQMNLAAFEYAHINSLIVAQEVRLKLANIDIDAQQKQIDNANEIDQFLRNKYTNDDLYGYLENAVRQTMYQTYLLAYDLAKKAELAFRFERRTTPAQSTDFITHGYFDPARDGLHSGQKLFLALKRMESAYQSDRGYDYELTKSVSLRQLNPYALLELREKGVCRIDLPEVLFDMDFPGHFFRRLKTVTLTIPCTVGPYTGVNATLRLLKHKWRWDNLASGGKDYLEKMEGRLDPRFRTDHVPIDAVAACSGQNDPGVFELSLKDERYLPFEGAGAVSSWQLQLPPKSFPPFDYTTISDVVMTIRYTSCEGGETLRRAAAESVTDFIATVEGYSRSQGLLTLFDLPAEFRSEWTKTRTSQPGTQSSVLILQGLNTRLPAFTRGRDISNIRAQDVNILTTLPLTTTDVALNTKYEPPRSSDTNSGDAGGDFTTFNSGPEKIGKLNLLRLTELDDPAGDWALKITLNSSAKVDASTKMWMIVRYRLGNNS